jgi:hypothetical protein
MGHLAPLSLKQIHRFRRPPHRLLPPPRPYREAALRQQAAQT